MSSLPILWATTALWFWLFHLSVRVFGAQFDCVSVCLRAVPISDWLAVNLLVDFLAIFISPERSRFLTIFTLSMNVWNSCDQGGWHVNETGVRGVREKIAACLQCAWSVERLSVLRATVVRPRSTAWWLVPPRHMPACVVLALASF